MRLITLASELRRDEDAELQDGAEPTAVLLELRRIARWKDRKDGELRAYYALIAEFDRLAGIAA